MEKNNVNNKENKLTSRKVSLLELRNLLVKRGNLDRVECAIYPTIIYNMEDKYFNAILDYLQTGKQTKLTFDTYNIDYIKEAYSLNETNYIKAVMILNSLELSGEYACYMDFPHKVE